MLVAAALLFISAVSARPSTEKKDYDRDRRGMTWSNFMPGGGMTLWSSANDDFWSPEPEHRLIPPPPSGGEFWASEPRDEAPRKDEGNSKGAPEAEAGAPGGPVVRPFDDDRERRPLKPSRWPGKKGYRNHEEDERPYSGSNASVNAWFPIMFGVLPPEGKTKSSAGSSSSTTDDDFVDQPRSITAIANSVNHASRGLANAHTVMFAGGEPPASFRRMARSLVFLQ